VIKPQCKICLVEVHNDSPAGKVIPTDRGDSFVCHQCCEELNSTPYVIVVDEEIYN